MGRVRAGLASVVLAFGLGMLAHPTPPRFVPCAEDEVYVPRSFPVQTAADLACDHPDNLR